MEKDSSISMYLLTTKNFQDKGFSEEIIKLMNQNQNFVPNMYDFYEPLKQSFDMNNLNEMVDTWMNTATNNLWYEKGHASGHFIAKRNKTCKTDYFISWTKNQQVNFNLLSIKSRADELTRKNYFFEFMVLCSEFIKVIEPVHGEIGKVLRNESVPINLRVRCPELKWMVIFGLPYIELFGREKLLSAPCYKVHEFSDNLIGLQLVESVFDEIPVELRIKIKRHLGEDAFVSEDIKNINRYKDGLVPVFDFSQILFDPTKPIEQPQVITRNRQT